MGTADQNNENAPIAFALVIAAGMSTAIGAAVVFNKKLVKLASKRFLAGSLGIAAGVMLYVSLVEIFVKSQDAFANHGASEADAYMFATVSFFGGIIFYKGIDYVVQLLHGGSVDHDVDIDLYDLDAISPTNSPRALAAAGGNSGVKPPPQQQSGSDAGYPHDHDVVVELSSGGSTVHPSPRLQTMQLRKAGRVQQQQNGEGPIMEEGDIMATNGDVRAKSTPSTAAGADTETGAVVVGDEEKLVRMGLMTAVAIGIHNFPEGLATFVGALSDPSVGVALAVAIAIHNIPEGLCVAIPVYYATGNRWKAFGWALLSGISEPIGAGLGWLVLKDVMSELVYGLLFGVVAGMMVNITLHELIPTAVRYDPGDKVTTNSIIVGMAIMALSLTLFLY